jgi:hypothetical protein
VTCAGVLATEGDKHKKQRRILSPAFGPAQIRQLSGIFLAKANEVCDSHFACSEFPLANIRPQLRNILISQFSKKSSEPQRIDLLSWLTKATLDIIGLAGFNYRFNCLTSSEENPNELYAAFSTLLKTVRSDLWGILTAYIPPLRLVVSDFHSKYLGRRLMSNQSLRSASVKPLARKR